MTGGVPRYDIVPLRRGCPFIGPSGLNNPSLNKCDVFCSLAVEATSLAPVTHGTIFVFKMSSV